MSEIQLTRETEADDVMVGQLRQMRERYAELERKIAYYEAPLHPAGETHFDHRFTDAGICIRCGEDAEEWDAGCVEEIVNDALGIPRTPKPASEPFEIEL